MEIIEIIKDIMDYIENIIFRHDNLSSGELKDHFLKYFTKIDKTFLSDKNRSIIETIKIDIMDVVNQLEKNNNNWNLVYQLNDIEDGEISTTIIQEMKKVYYHLNDLNLLLFVDNIYEIMQQIEITYEEYEKIKKILDQKIQKSKFVKK